MPRAEQRGRSGQRCDRTVLGRLHPHHAVLTEECGQDQQCFAISDALTSNLLPHRKQVMEDFLAQTPCEDACNSGPEGREDNYAYSGEPAGPIDVRKALSPDGSPDIARLLELEQEWRAQGSPRTIGGGSTKVTH